MSSFSSRPSRASSSASSPPDQWSASTVFALNSNPQTSLLDSRLFLDSLIVALSSNVTEQEALTFQQVYGKSSKTGLTKNEFVLCVDEQKANSSKKKKRSFSLTSRDSKSANNATPTQTHQIDQLKKNMIKAHDSCQKNDYDLKRYPAIPSIPVTQAESITCLLGYLTGNYEPMQSLWFNRDELTVTSSEEKRTFKKNVGKVYDRIGLGGALTSEELSALAGGGLNAICEGIRNALSDYAPLLPYASFTNLTNAKPDVAHYRLAFEGWEIKTNESPNNDDDTHCWNLFASFFAHFKDRVTHEDPLYFRLKLRKFLKDNSLSDQMKDLDYALSTHKTKEYDFFENLSLKHGRPNPCDNDLPSVMIGKAVGFLFFRNSENINAVDTNQSKVNGVFKFLLSSNNLDAVLNPRPVAEPVTSRVQSYGVDDWPAQRVFSLYDNDNSGTLDTSELEFALTAIVGRLVKSEEVEKLLSKFDKNGDDELDIEEFESMAAEAKKHKKGFSGLFSFKSKATKVMEKAAVANEREKLTRLEAAANERNKVSKIEAASPKRYKPQQPTRGSLTSAPRLSASTISNLKTLINFIERSCMDEVGIYRVPGSHNKVGDLTDRTLNGPVYSIDLVYDMTDNDINVAASVFGRVLSLHRPLVPYEMYGKLMKCMSVADLLDLFGTANANSSLWNEIDRDFYHYCLTHFAYVSSHEASNKMGPSQLGTCVGCKLFRGNEVHPSDMKTQRIEGKRKVEVFVLMVAYLKHGKRIKEELSYVVEDDLRIVEDDDEQFGVEEEQAVEKEMKKKNKKEKETADVDQSVDRSRPQSYEPEHDSQIHYLNLPQSPPKANAASAAAPVGSPLRVTDMSVSMMEGSRMGSIVDSSLLDATISQLKTAAPSSAQLTIKVSWKKNSQPKNDREVEDAFVSYGEIVRVVIKWEKKFAGVMFKDIEGVKNAMDSYKGGWKIKPMAPAGAGAGNVESVAEESTMSMSTTLSESLPLPEPTVKENDDDNDAATANANATPLLNEAVAQLFMSQLEKTDQKNQSVIDSPKKSPRSKSSKAASSISPKDKSDIEARSVKVLWKTITDEFEIPNKEQISGVFSAYGKLDNVVMKDDAHYAILVYEDALQAQIAVQRYSGVYTVKLVRSAITSSVFVSPKNKNKSGSSSSNIGSSGRGSGGGGSEVKNIIKVAALNNANVNVNEGIGSGSGSEVNKIITVSASYNLNDESTRIDAKLNETAIANDNKAQLQATTPISPEQGSLFERRASRMLSTSNFDTTSTALSPNKSSAASLQSSPVKESRRMSYEEAHITSAAGTPRSNRKSSISHFEVPTSVSDYNKMEADLSEQGHNALVEKLTGRLELAETALYKAMNKIGELNAEYTSAANRIEVDSRSKIDDEQTWTSSSLTLAMQLKVTERSEKEAREELRDVKMENQELKASLSSLERTGKTIEIVKEQATEKAKREVGALLTMQENRLEAQSSELRVLSEAKISALEENAVLSKQNKVYCEELVAWRNRAEAAELQLKSLGHFASSNEEKKVLEFARLLQSRVVGVGVDDVPRVTSFDFNLGDLDAKASIGESDGSSLVDSNMNSSASFYAIPTLTPAQTKANNMSQARTRVLTSNDILQQAWDCQRSLAERLDREIAQLNNANARYLSNGKRIESLTGYRASRPFMTHYSMDQQQW